MKVAASPQIYMAMPEGSLDSRFPVCAFPNIDHLAANDKDFSLTLEMTIRESDVSQSLRLLVLSPAANHQSFIFSNNTSAANL